MGYDLKKVERMVTEIYQIDKDELPLRGRQKTRAEARSLFCYWAVRELGISGTSLARRLGMSQSGVVYAVNKGEKIAKEKKYKLLG
jgi:chromosomal replication initiation ATPase DnaA